MFMTCQDVDIVMVPMHPNVPDTTCVAVFDGHGGPAVAACIAEKIIEAVISTEAFQKDNRSPESLALALCEGFLVVDEMLKKDPEYATSCDEVGSTGLFAIITPKDIVCANVGDSRCIMSNSKIPEVLQLSVDHKPDLEFEKQRILAAGGTVFRGRVCGGVAVSRSFGDLWFKRNADLKPHQQLVTAEPSVRVQRRDPADEFLALCCDGIYDVMSNDQLRKFIRSKLKNGVKDPKDISEMLLDECLAKGSRDNMSAIIVLFKAALQK
ncbi:putative PPM-type phosphatase domain, protein phosphatase 2C family [Plasmopara halstedii]